MRRIYESAAYGPEPGCYWAETVSAPDWPRLRGSERADVAVIGGGFTGLNAALDLAASGARVALLEAETPGWGASGRNGGFCCLGGAKAPEALLRRRFGAEGLAEWHATQIASIDTVAGRLAEHGIDADTHSEGETCLAHTPRAMARLRAEAEEAAQAYGTEPRLTERDALRQEGLGGTFHGALTLPIGFALNPRKYHHGLARAAMEAGVACFSESPVTGLVRDGAHWRLTTPEGEIRADQVVIATNGYSSEDLPDWLRARTLPVQSSIIVTRPLTPEEQQRQGWTSAQMSYDSRRLLHYFRKLPNGRFLFGMRGGLSARPASVARLRARIRRDFHAMFPEWRDVEITHDWSGLICLMANLTPYVGPVPGHPGLHASLGYHGNGVAMSSHSGRLLAAQMTTGAPVPAVLSAPPRRFPLGRFRRWLLAPAYAAAETLDL
ncbi:NAD(P)/FAD-dependent oxidoreductase [Litorisediminicola beolgyonensis]|uniref:NAD(P)/FAD-dependent oxidoreductase n=1 Tax=Litorisediminicola beolgyonensis TaxID=1173614 RepID=A0ABW3ZHT9_9RHOB